MTTYGPLSIVRGVAGSYCLMQPEWPDMILLDGEYLATVRARPNSDVVTLDGDRITFTVANGHATYRLDLEHPVKHAHVSAFVGECIERHRDPDFPPQEPSSDA